MKEACVSLGFSGCNRDGHIPGGPIWMIHWLPKGYAPTAEDRLLGVFLDTDGRWSEGGLSGDEMPPLLRVVKKAIEDHLREHPEDVAGALANG